MRGVLGIVFILACVFGGYTASGGKFGVILHALPYELTIIFGGAIGALIVGNPGHIIKGTVGGIKKSFGGPKWNQQDFLDILCLLFTIIKMIKSKGILVIEAHIENPQESDIFQQYPRILKDHFATDFICDTLRMLSMNLDDPHQVYDAMET